MPTGSLTIIGTGIKFISHLTVEAQAALDHAQTLFYLVNDPASSHWLQQRYPHAHSLADAYQPDQRRFTVYRQICQRILASVDQGHSVTCLFYGHPSVLVTPVQLLVRHAQQHGIRLTIVPAISAEDCLFADLQLDPASCGWQSFDATDFLIYQRQFDPHSHLILWQVGVTGELSVRQHYQPNAGLRILSERLTEVYPSDQPIIVYEAAQYPSFPPRIEHSQLDQLANLTISTLSTLYIRPKPAPTPSPMMLERLGISPADLGWDGVLA